MAATRLRRTFHYPSDTDDDDAVEDGLDAQDRETVLSNLTTQDTKTTSFYTAVLLALPLLPIVFYIPLLFGIYTIIPSLAAIASLLASAYTLYFLALPPASTKPPSSTSTKKPKSRNLSTSQPSIFSAPTSKSVPYISSETSELLRRYTIPTNTAIVAILAMLEPFRGRTWSEGLSIGGGFVPLFIWGVVLGARSELRSIDFEDLNK